LVGVASGEPTSVDVDFVVDELEVFLYLGELGGHVGAVGLHEGKSFLFVAGPGGDELGVAADGLDGHAGGPQLGADGDPVQVELLVAAPSGVVAVDGGDDQARAFVVAQGVRTNPGAGSGLGDAHTRLGVGVSGLGYRRRLDFEHALNPSVMVMSASTLPNTTAGELSQRRRLLVLAICCASMIVVVMDISIVNVALPAIRRALHASVSGLAWTIDAYTLVLACFLLLAGSTADRVGRRRVFQVGLAAFGLGSLLCGLAPRTGARTPSGTTPGTTERATAGRTGRQLPVRPQLRPRRQRSDPVLGLRTRGSRNTHRSGIRMSRGTRANLTRPRPGRHHGGPQ